MPISSFQELRAWQHARVLVDNVYRQTQTWQDFGLRNQLQRASISVMSNIAEGFSRYNRREFRYFLRISLGSCAETTSLIIAATDLGYISSSESENLLTKVTIVSRCTTALWKSIGCQN